MMEEINGFIQMQASYPIDTEEASALNLKNRYKADLVELRDKFKADLNEAINGTGNFMTIDIELQLEIVKNLNNIVRMLDSYIEVESEKYDTPKKPVSKQEFIDIRYRLDKDADESIRGIGVARDLNPTERMEIAAKIDDIVEIFDNHIEKM